ncbi:hypothetical protein [Leptospira weilii]|uniref:hypothetical protein n=1 Tax=Leptospira weilii TaxID=28184 RepID=UPI0003163B08|nr:hypothetical protein [Leptospira weilii]
MKRRSKKHRKSGKSRSGKMDLLDVLLPLAVGTGAYLGGLFFTRQITKEKGMKETGLLSLAPAAVIAGAAVLALKDKTMAAAAVAGSGILSYNVASTIGLVGSDPKNPILASLSGDDDVIDITPGMARDLISSQAQLAGPESSDPLSGDFVMSGNDYIMSGGPDSSDPLS